MPGDRPLQVDLQVLADQWQDAAVDAGLFVTVLIAVYLFGRLLLLPPLVRGIKARNPSNPTLVYAVDQYLKVAFLLVALPIATSAAGYGNVLSGSALVIAAGTLALGVAGQAVIGNLVSGLFLVADPDFNVGDFIEWNDQSGTVERITLRVTRVRTPAEEVLTVPNTELTTTAVRNPFARGTYRVSVTVTVPYSADVEIVRDELAAAARERDAVASDPSPVAHIASLGDEEIEIEALFWVVSPRSVNVGEVRTRFSASVIERLDEAEIDLSPPSRHEISGEVDVGREEP